MLGPAYRPGSRKLPLAVHLLRNVAPPLGFERARLADRTTATGPLEPEGEPSLLPVRTKTKKRDEDSTRPGGGGARRLLTRRNKAKGGSEGGVARWVDRPADQLYPPGIKQLSPGDTMV